MPITICGCFMHTNIEHSDICQVSVSPPLAPDRDLEARGTSAYRDKSGTYDQFGIVVVTKERHLDPHLSSPHCSDSQYQVIIVVTAWSYWSPKHK